MVFCPTKGMVISMKKFTALLILAAMVAANLSCEAGNDPNEGQEVTSNDEVTLNNSETELSRENTPDSLPELDFKDATVRIVYRGDEKTRLLEIEGEDTGDVVSDAVYARNIKVEERLNVKLEFIAGNEEHEAYMRDIRTTLMAFDDSYDIIDSIQWRATPLAVEGYFKNLNDAPYLDYSKPWWSNEYMNEIQVSKDSRYLLSGDISVTQLRNMSCVYFNKRLYEEAFGDPDELYNIVLDGEWTYDLLKKYVKEVFRDLDGDTKASEGDIIGIGSTPVAQTDHFSYTAGMQFTERDKDGYPTLISNQERNLKIVETIYNLYYETDGVLIYTDPYAMSNELVKIFNDGNSLFYANRFYSAEDFRDMKDNYGIIPFPKLDETQEDYYSLVHDGTTLFCIPTTVNELELPCAVLEAMCAENYRTVIPAYYEVALKVKYTKDDVSSQIIDMLHDNVRTDFVYANNYCFSSSVKLGTITRSLMGYGGGTPNKNYMSTYDSIKSAVESDIENIKEQAKANS